jgi:hypothetical protein
VACGREGDCASTKGGERARCCGRAARKGGGDGKLALTSQTVRCTVTLCSKYTRALTFENIFKAAAAACSILSAPAAMEAPQIPAAATTSELGLEGGLLLDLSPAR